jgi:hypothetical protein
VRRLRLVVAGIAASDPYAGMAWMHMQIVVGLQRLGHEVYYFEVGSHWPYDPVRSDHVADSEYALPYLERLAESFGIDGHWAYRRSYSDRAWFGLPQAKAEDLLRHADAVINVSGATSFELEGLPVGTLVYLGTDPGEQDAEYFNGNPKIRALISEHDAVATYGENIGTPECPLPPLPGLRAHTRQPVLMDLWEAGPPEKEEFTTVCNWRGVGEVEFRGEKYYWRKDKEFLRFVDLPKRIGQPIELAMPRCEDREMLISNGWRLTDSHAMTLDPWPYRDYVRASRGEFTVAKDQYVRLPTGWFSERSACYLAAGRPVVTQDTGFSRVLPTGEGLFSFNTMDEIVAAFEAIRTDYEKHSRAARAIAEEYFRAETVLAKLLRDLGL